MRKFILPFIPLVVFYCAYQVMVLAGVSSGTVGSSPSFNGATAGGALAGTFPNPTLAPLTNFSSIELQQNATTQNSFANTLDKLNIWAPLMLPYAVTWSHICENIGVADAVNKYDIGLYTSTGAVIADIGAQTLPSTGFQCQALMLTANCTANLAPSPCCTGAGTGSCPTSITSQPGLYFITSTGHATTATLFDSGANYMALAIGTFSTGVTANGILPASITPPSLTVPSVNAFMPSIMLE